LYWECRINAFERLVVAEAFLDIDRKRLQARDVAPSSLIGQIGQRQPFSSPAIVDVDQGIGSDTDQACR
jgi:hypothetical protein